MKNILSVICLFAVLATGCSQEELVENQSSSLESLVFTASLEEGNSRTYLDETMLQRWTKGDQIALFVANTLNSQYKFDGATGDNNGTFTLVNTPSGTGDELTRHYAVYPYASKVKITENGVISVTLPEEQDYAENSFGVGDNTMVAVTNDTMDTSLNFKNVGGYFKLHLYGDDVTVKTITLEGNGGEKIAGKASVTPVYGGEPAVSMAANATRTITLDCGDGVKIGDTAETATAFWMVVPPTVFEDGFKVSVTNAAGITFTQTTSKKVVIERNMITPMAAYKVDLIPNNQIWYTTTNGKPLNYTSTYEIFGANIVSDIYMDGRGVITFDGDVTKVGSLAFDYCRNLYTVTLPPCVTEIDYAFRGCANLNRINIPQSVNYIASGVFEGCTNLEEFSGKFVTPDGRCLIFDGEVKSFAPLGLFDSYTIPDGVTKVGGFAECTLKTVVLPESVTSVSWAAFRGCKNMMEFKGKFAADNGRCLIVGNELVTFAANCGASEYVIPENVKKIGWCAFEGCNLTSVTITNNVSVIDRYSFRGSEKLTSVTISESVTEIGEQAFWYCKNLATVYCKPTTPPTILFTGIFSGNAENLKIYVPAGSVDAYKAANYWSDYTILADGQE